jgi:hypothetical protein
MEKRRLGLAPTSLRPHGESTGQRDTDCRGGREVRCPAGFIENGGERGHRVAGYLRDVPLVGLGNHLFASVGGRPRRVERTQTQFVELGRKCWKF